MSNSRPDPGPVLDLLNAFRRSQCLLTAVELGVFDTLAASSKPLTAEQLARVLPPRSTSSASASSPHGDTATTAGAGCSHDGVDRLCRALVSLGLLEAHVTPQQQHQDRDHDQEQQQKQQQEEGGSSLRPGGSPPLPYAFSLTPCAAAYLVAQSPDSLAGYCVHSQKVVWPLFGSLPDAVSSGANVWQQRFGQPGAQIFARIYSTPHDVLRFMRGMHSFAQLSAPRVVRAFDLSWARTLVDLGGATGALAAAACGAYPQLACTVVDLPHVVEAGREHFGVPELQQAGRLRWLGADFFEEGDKLQQQVDVVVLSRILHDWDPPRCARLLRLAHSLLAPGGALLVAEMLLQDDRLGPAPVLMQDLNMLCQTHGRERSVAEYRELLAAAGFEPYSVEGRVTGSYLDALLARKSRESVL